jgi:hypothetical protein
MMQVVERRGRAERLFKVPLKHLVGKTTQSLVRDSPIRAVRWLGGLEQTHQRAACVQCIQWTQRKATLSYHSRYLPREIINKVTFSAFLTVFRVWLQDDKSSKILR